LNPLMPDLKGRGLDHFAFHRTNMAGLTGFEPAFSCVTGRRGLRLLHSPVPSAEDAKTLQHVILIPQSREKDLSICFQETTEMLRFAQQDRRPVSASRYTTRARSGSGHGSRTHYRRAYEALMVFRSTRPQQTGQGTKNRTWSTTFQAWDAATTPYPASWSGREDLNLQSPVSETGGLPLPYVLNPGAAYGTRIRFFSLEG
jgi:hypothetical protein